MSTPMARVSVKITGISPLLVHAFSMADALAATSGTRTSVRTTAETPELVAEQSLYRSADDPDQLIIPTVNVFSAIIAAGTYHKIGKSKVTTLRSSMVPSGITIDGTELVLTPQTWVVNTMPVRIPATGGRILRHRPMFPEGWSLAFDLEVDTDLFALPLVRQLVDDAGKRQGLGDYRPACRGPYGRFVVDSWVVHPN